MDVTNTLGVCVGVGGVRVGEWEGSGGEACLKCVSEKKKCCLHSV